MTETHGHPILTWYDYDEVHRIELRQGGKKIERFYGYETEDDIKRQLRQNEQYGDFEVIGVDERGNYLPHRGEITVPRPGRAIKGLLAKTKHYRGDTVASDASSALLEHDAERQRQIARERERLMRRNEDLFAERLAEKERIFEERRQQIEEAAEERARMEAERAERIEEEARRQMEELQEQSTSALDKLKELYEARLQDASQGSNMTQSVLATSLTAQVKQAEANAAMWRERYDRMEQTYERYKREEREREDRLREQMERERERLREQLDDERTSYRDRIEQAEEKLEREHRMEVSRLEDRIERLKDERDSLKADIAKLEQQVFQIGITTQLGTKDGLSEEAKELRDLLGVAKEHNIDVSEIVRDRLGLPEVQKEPEKGALDSMIQGLLPKILGDQLPKLPGGGTQNRNDSAGSDEPSPTGGLTLEPI